MKQFRKPKILFLCDKRGWAYDTTAKNLKHHLSGQFDFDISYVAESPEINPESYDLIYVFWWGEGYHRRFTDNRQRIVKEISSHRWQFEERYGMHAPDETLERYLHDAGHIVATSERIKKTFEELHSWIYHYPLGVDVDLFQPRGERSGGLSLGWAGNIGDKQKGVLDVLLPACDGEYQLHQAAGGLSMPEMAQFYNSIDVICIASTAEGTPLPLIEAMACGCFPVATDVGVVPEIIKNGENGLIVERTPEAFRKAFAWCQDNLDFVRRAGLENAELIRRERSWQVVSQQFAEVVSAILEEVGVSSARVDTEAEGYLTHFSRINPGGISDSAYKSVCSYIREDVEELLPASKNAVILEVGTGFGHMLRFLVEHGYRRVWGIDLAKDLLDVVRSSLGDKVERLECADARDFFVKWDNRFDCILMLDMLEHVTKEEASTLLSAAFNASREGGRIIIRTPNMANILGNYSLYMDSTHMYGYTEWTLIQLLEKAGFQRVSVHIPTRFATKKRKLNAWLVKKLHEFIYSITDRARPRWYGKNVVVSAVKEASSK